MKNFKISSLITILLIAMLALVGCGKEEAKPASPSTEVAAIKEMAGTELVDKNGDKTKDSFLLIDVRSEEEYLAGHVPHAINIFIDELEANLAIIEDYKEKTVVLICNSGNKSGQAAEILVNNGFKDVYNAEGVKKFEYELVHYKDVRGAQFEEIIKDTANVVIVDVREAKQATSEGMIAGAINVPFSEVSAHLDQLPKDKTIALYCNTGTKSATVAKELEALGYTNIVNSIEGVKEYAFSNIKK